MLYILHIYIIQLSFPFAYEQQNQVTPYRDQAERNIHEMFWEL